MNEVRTRGPSQTDTRRFYDRISRAYDFIADSSEHAIRDFGIQALAPARSDRVLEVGFGTGHGLVSLADAVGKTGQVHGVDLSWGMSSVARARVDAHGLRNVKVAIGDARALCFQSDVFDAAFLSFTLELFDSEIPEVLGQVHRVLRPGGRVGVVAMEERTKTNAMIGLYQWLHRHFPHFVDCQPIDTVGLLQAAGFETETAGATEIWTLPVVAVIGTKRPSH